MSTMPTLTAIIMADNFSPQFSRMGESECWGLRKLGSLSHLECCLQWIARTLVNRVIVVVAHEDAKARERIDSLLRAYNAFFAGQTVFDKTIGSVGDAIRAVDRANLLNGEFMLVHNPATICVNTLDREIQEFLELRKENKNNVMMLIYRKSGNKNNVPVQVENETGKLLSIDEEMEDWDSAYEGSDTDDATVRKDIEDTGIALCAPSVATEFSGNFDFQERDELIDHILENEEVLCQNITVHVLSDEVVTSTANNMADLIRMQREFLQRWYTPIAPNRRSLRDRSRDSRIVTHRNNVFITMHNEIIPAAKLKKIRNAFIAGRVTFGNDVVMDNVKIGEGATIGHNVVLKNCIVGEGVTIADDIILRNCIIDDNVTIGSKCTIGENCYIEKDYDLPDNSHIPDNAFVSKDLLSFSRDNSSASSDSGGNVSEGDDNDDFFDDITDAMTEAFNTLDSSENSSKNLLIEINRSRLIYSLPIEEVARQLIWAFLSLKQCSSLKAIEKLIDEWLEVFENYYSSEFGQRDLLERLQEFTESHPSFTKKLKHVVSYFYNNDVLNDDAIYKWFDVMERGSEMYKEISQLVTALKAQNQE
uniref:Translation initiation factor eIF2B subunit epsilon n=1 Tax=Steinernema glaseri TaxID=37863 RepID=A0A1I7YYG5_9BILA